MRFTLREGRWYACELIGDEFGDDLCSYSPIKVYAVKPHGKGNRQFTLAFYHANYPAGVRDKEYTMRTLERGTRFILAKSLDHDPPRILQIYEIDIPWLQRHFAMRPVEPVQQWLDRHA